MRQFAYHRPATLEAAVTVLRAAAEGAPLAGGMTLIPLMKQGLAGPSDLVDLAGLDELRYVREDAGGVRIGALTTHDAIASSPLVAAAIPGLASLAARIGDPQVRNVGTLGGAIATNDPAGDYPAALVALDATVHTDRRSLVGAAFFEGPFATALAPGEIVTAVTFPAAPCSAYDKLTQAASGYAVAGVMVARVDGRVRVAVIGAGPCVFRARAMEAALEDDFSPSALAGIGIGPAGLARDPHASAEYRAHLTGIVAARAVAAALCTKDA